MMGSILSRTTRKLLLLKEVQRAIDFVLSESVGDIPGSWTGEAVDPKTGKTIKFTVRNLNKYL